MTDQVSPYATLPSSSSFRVSSQFLAGDLPLPYLWDFHKENSGTHPLFIYDEPDGTTIKIMWSQGVDAMYRAARYLKPSLVRHSAHPGDVPPVVGILTFRDIPTSWAIITAVLRLGATAFLISPTNSPLTLANLLEKSKCSVLLTGSEEAIQNLVINAQSLMDENSKPVVIRGPSYPELYLSDTAIIDTSELPKVTDMDSPAVIVHSSGSTGSPSLVISSHRTLVHGAITTYFGDKDLCGCICGAQSFPFYHNTGITAYIALPSTTGQICTIFNPLQLPRSPTAENVLASAERCKANYLYTVPAFIETWASSPENLVSLRRLETILFAGSPLKTHIGNYLANNGVRLSSMYGTSECGTVSAIVFDGDPEDWEYIKPTRQTTVLWEVQEGAENLFEPVVLESPYKRIAKPNTTRQGLPACRAGDLFEKHPSKEGLWRVYGRSDTLIVHSNGKKTDPISIESIISKHPLVKYAIVFGHNQPHAGVVIWPNGASDLRASEPALRNLRAEIWPSIEEANKASPTHSRIVKETMIIGTTKPFSVTDKHSLRRAAILQDYAEEIAEVFRALDEATVSHIPVPLPKSWNPANSLSFVRAVIHWIQSGSGSHLPRDYDDLFQYGIDSLQAVLIRNALARALSATGMTQIRLETSLIYTHSTIASLSQFVSGYANQKNFIPSVTATRDSAAETMRDLLREFTTPFDLNPFQGVVSDSASCQQCVLMTGSLGTLGSHILFALLKSSSVARVYVLNRISKGRQLDKMRDVQRIAFERQRIPGIFAESEKICYLNGDIMKADLGLDPSICREVRDTVTAIIHNAWVVNFVLPLTSFRPLLQSLRNLLQFALLCEDTPRFVFLSSVSVANGWQDANPIPEVALKEPYTAIGTGYSESKWVAEQMIHSVRKETVLKPVIARLGQLCSSNSEAGGRWNSNEWFPLIVRSAESIGSLPYLRGDLSWLPFNLVASVIVDLIHNDEPIECANIVHPRPIPGRTVTETLAGALNVGIISHHEWVQRLQEFSRKQEARRVPAVALLDLFVAEGDNSVFDDTGKIYQQCNGLRASAALRDFVAKLSEHDILGWLRDWREEYHAQMTV